MRYVFGCTVMLATLGLMPGAAFAQQSADHDVLKRYCTGDYLEHCGEYAPGGPEVEACFRRKVRSLSPNCSAAIVAYQQGQGGFRKVNTAR